MDITWKASVGLEENLDGAWLRVQIRHRDWGWNYNLCAAQSQWLKYRRRVRLVSEEMVCNYKAHSE